MSTQFLVENFEGPALDSRLQWFCPPSRWQIEHSCLVIQPDAKTDFWQRTHYGFQNDNGHFLCAVMESDFVLSTHVRFYPLHQYDQAGLMVRFSPDCWLKTSVEYELSGPSKLGAVVTNFGYSDWSTQDIEIQPGWYHFRILRQGSDYQVDIHTPERAQNWTQIRIAHLHADPNRPVQCGIYACCPIDQGYTAQFDDLQINTERIG